MRDRTLLSLSPALLQSLETIRQFIQNYPPKEFDEQCWRIISLAIGSKKSNEWSDIDIDNMLDLYRQLSSLGNALQVVDKELNYS